MITTKGRTMPARGGEEHDMLCAKCRRMLKTKPGRAKAAKRSFNKRVRRAAKGELE